MRPGVFEGRRLLIVGNPDPVHVGAHLNRAALRLGLDVRLADTREAFKGGPWRTRFDWWLRGRRPSSLGEFSQQVVHHCREYRPVWLLSVGLAPIESEALGAIGNVGVKRLNYLTDDPWNPALRAPWFAKALPLYDHIFSPRRANLEELQRVSRGSVSHLPFAYSPDIHFPETVGGEESESFDVLFAGGADRDRIPYIVALIEGGFKVGLFGGYWDRYSKTRMHTRGFADAGALRRAIASSKVALCLVRRANRDGTSMRSFEIAAIGACMLVEDTPEHRDLFGTDGKAVRYFRNSEEMRQRLRCLMGDHRERQRLAEAAHGVITSGKHTYADRLTAMLASTRESDPLR